MKRLSHNMFFLCLLGGFAGGILGYFLWGGVGVWLSLAAVSVVWAEEQYDPFHRYKRAYYTTKVLAEFSDALLGWDRCTILLIEDLGKSYRVRFPLSWRMTTTSHKYLSKDSPKLTLLD
jgi:hypothetical protein